MSDDGIKTFDDNSVKSTGCDFAVENPAANTNVLGERIMHAISVVIGTK